MNKGRGISATATAAATAAATADILVEAKRLRQLLEELNNCECFRGTRHQERVENELALAEEAIYQEMQRRKTAHANAVAGIV